MASEPLYGKGVLAGRFCGGSVHLVSIFVVVLVEEICRPVALGYVREIIVLRGIPGERREYHHRWLRRAEGISERTNHFLFLLLFSFL
jgi:hypothetical protein